jgi:hypothetical protein
MWVLAGRGKTISSSIFSGRAVPSSISVKGEKAVAEHSVRQQPRSARMSCVASGVREGPEHHSFPHLAGIRRRPRLVQFQVAQVT